MRDLKLRIMRKTAVPIVNPKFDYRSEWRTVAKLNYGECHHLFKYFNDHHGFVNDAQFALFLKKNFGPGIYYVQAWSHGKEGFFNFMKIEIGLDCFRRLPKRETLEMKENKALLAEQRRLKHMLKNNGDEEAVEGIKETLNDLKEDSEMNKEIIDLEKGRNGCVPVLKTMGPIYKPHDYQEVLNPQELAEEKLNEEPRAF